MDTTRTSFGQDNPCPEFDPKIHVQATSKIITGIDPNAPMAVNEQGGMQSHLSYRFDLIDGPAMFRLARVLDYGARKYAPDNWRKITVREHINHLLVHAFAWLSGDKSDDHLGHLLCRSMMATAVAETDGYSAKQGDE